ncbi:hypothetical protein BU17DRAFT_70186 [Hysterangium stoloniferum]|nr:hypothetical protein BU17DRAFT_70186 [Hysterangium stoloniferum]
MPHFSSFGYPYPRPSEDSILEDNPYLYRVYLEKENKGIQCHGFVARIHHKNPSRSYKDLTPVSPSETDIINHVAKWAHNKGPLISTSLSFVYAVVEACRRIYKSEYDSKDLHIAFISSAVIAEKCTTVSLLHHSCINGYISPKDEVRRKAKYFANSASKMLVIGQIPPEAIEFTISVDALLKVLPDFWMRDSKDPKPMPVFYEALSGDSITRSADRELRSALESAGLTARIRFGVELAINLINNADWVNEHRRSPENVSKLALEMAHYPCDKDEILSVSTKLQSRSEKIQRLVESEYSNSLNSAEESLENSTDSLIDGLRHVSILLPGRLLSDLVSTAELSKSPKEKKVTFFAGTAPPLQDRS